MTEPAPKRRLPILQPSADDDVEPRPAFHWIGLGAGATLLGWLLLANIANAIVGAFARAGDSASDASTGAALLASNLVALALAAFGGGALVGRFGGAAKAREASLAGLAAALFACAFAVITSAQGLDALVWVVTIVVVGGAGAGFGLLGGRVGVRARKGGRSYDA